jgi:cell division protein ZapD
VSSTISEQFASQSQDIKSSQKTTLVKEKQQTKPIIFEYPLKESFRNFLRLEFLFNQYEKNAQRPHSDNHIYALKTLIDILDLLERSDTRSEITKELSRLSKSFDNYRENPHVDTTKLEVFLEQIKLLYQWIICHRGKLGEKLRQNPFIESVKNRFNVSSAICSFDSPDLFLFLKQPVKKRQESLMDWLSSIQGVKTSIEVILKLLRESGKWQSNKAPMGSFLIESEETPPLLLRVRLSSNEAIFPDFSCGKQRSFIHFMKYADNQRKIPQQKEIEFELACCYLI